MFANHNLQKLIKHVNGEKFKCYPILVKLTYLVSQQPYLTSIWLLRYEIQFHVALYSTAITIVFPKPQGYALIVICNDCYPRREEVGCKDLGHQ